MLTLLGPSGAGKTTTVRILTTMLRPDTGSARMAGLSVVRQPAAVRQVIGRAGQSAAVEEHLTGRENLVMAVRLYHLGRVQSHHRAAELLTRFELSQAAEHTVRWLERITAGRAEDLQLMYGVGAERLLPEVELDTLDGCRGSPRSASDRPPPASSSSTSTAPYSIPPGSTTATAARSPRPSGGCSPAPWRSSPGAGPDPTRVPALGTPGSAAGDVQNEFGGHAEQETGQ